MTTIMTIITITSINTDMTTNIKVELVAPDIAAYRAGNAPHILQVFEVGTATMMAAKGAVKPVGEVMNPIVRGRAGSGTLLPASIHIRIEFSYRRGSSESGVRPLVAMAIQRHGFKLDHIDHIPDADATFAHAAETHALKVLIEA